MEMDTNKGPQDVSGRPKTCPHYEANSNKFLETLLKLFERILKEELLLRTSHLLDSRQHGFLTLNHVQQI